MGIESFRHKGLAELFRKGSSAKIGHRYAKSALLILDHLDYAAGLEDLAGVKDFHALKGERKETYSMHVNGNYVITFGWNGRNIINVNFEDYHGK